MKSYDNQIPRPSGFDGYVCDGDVKKRIQNHIKAAEMRGTMPPHMLLSGGPGTGKTTLAGIVAKTMNVPMIKFVGMDLTRPDQLRELFKLPAHGGILFIDEIHSTAKEVLELLYPVMEDGVLPAKGNPRLLLSLNPVMVVGATTEIGSLPRPLVDRFTVKIRIPDYDQAQMETVVSNMAAKLAGAKFEDMALRVIAERSRYTPRVAGGLLTQVLDSAVADGVEVVTRQFAEGVMETLGVYPNGIDGMDKEVMKVLLANPNGVGLETLAACVREDAGWIAESVEPFLIRKGYMLRTKSGRVLTGPGKVLAESMK